MRLTELMRRALWMLRGKDFSRREKGLFVPTRPTLYVGQPRQSIGHNEVKLEMTKMI